MSSKHKLIETNLYGSRRAVVETLEPRLLLSAGLEAFVINNDSLQVETLLQPATEAELIPQSDSHQTYDELVQRLELVFVDTDTPDYQQLLDDLLNSQPDDRQFEVILLDNEQSGIEQISEALASRGDLDAIHIISHGADGTLDLGNSRLEFDSLLQNARQIANWGQALTAEGDLLLYGCNLASTTEGQSLINALANLTGADVAASNDLTGNAEKGGDWELEYTVGEVETHVALSKQMQQQWQGTLAAMDDSYSVDEDGTLISNDEWFDSNWQYRKTLSFDNLAQPEDLTNFPVLIVLDGTRIDYSNTQDNGEDLRFTDSDGTLLEHEIESWDESGNSYVWVKVPQIDASSDTDYIWMYYGNNSAADGQDLTGSVWSNDYSAVYHLDDPGTAFDDSSASSFNGTDVNGTASVVNGQIGTARDFDSLNNEYIDLGSNLDFISNTSVATMSAWINTDTLTGDGDIVSVTINGVVDESASRLGIARTGDDLIVYARSVDNDTDVVNVTTTTSPLLGETGQWHLVHVVADYSADSVLIYFDGVLQTTTGTPNFINSVTPNTSSTNAAIGANEDGLGAFFDGKIDEVHIAKAARSLDWIKAEYESQRDNFVTFGYQQTVAGVLGNDIDPQGDTLTATLISGTSNGALTFNSDGTFVYTPNPEFNGSDSFVYQLDDGNGNTSQATVLITVNPVNDAPAADAGGPYIINEGDSLSLDASATTDIDGDVTLTYEWDLNNDGTYGDVTGVAPMVDWTTLQSFGINDDGAYTIGLRVSDGNGGVDTTTATLTVENTAPTLTASGAASALEGASYTLNLSAIDPGDDTIASWTINWGDGNIQTVAGNPASVSHVYDEPGFTYNVTVSAQDEDGTFFDSALLIASAATGTDGYVLRYGYDPATGTADLSSIQVLNTTNPADLDWAGDVIVGPDGYIYVTGYQSNNIVRFDAGTGLQDGSFEISTGRPVSIAFGPDGNLYVASDVNGIKSFDVSNPTTAINTWTVSYTPEEMDFGPDGKLYIGDYVSPGRIYQHDITDLDWTDDAVFTTGMPAASTRAEQFAFGPDGNLYVARLSGEILRFNGTTGAYMDTFATPGTQGAGWPNGPTGVAFGPDGNLYVTRVDSVIRYDGTTGAYIDDFVPDGNGVVNPWFTTFTPNHQVYVQNSAPTLADGTLSGTFEDDTNPAGESIATIFAGKFSDLNGSFNGVAVVSNPELATEGSWQYSTDNGASWYDVGTVADDAAALVLHTSTLIRFLPAADFNGNPTELTVRALDNMYFGDYTDGATRENIDTSSNGNGTPIAAGTTTISTSISPVNDAPVMDLDADDSSGSTGVDYQTTFIEAAGPVNLTDADVSLIDIDTVNLVSITVTLTNELDNGNKEMLAANAGSTGLTVNWDSNADVLTISGAGTVADYLSVLSTVTYDNSANNPDTTDRVITFVADDGTDTSVIATTTVSIVQIQKAPVANDDAFTVDEGSTTILNLASNDTDQDGDLDPATIAIVSGPSNGTITAINADGTVEYVHDGSETLSDSFTYTIRDAIGALSNIATVTLTINPVNDAPVAVTDSFTVNEGSTTNLDLAANDSDADDGLDLTSIAIVSGPTNGSITVNADGTVDYTHDGSETISDSFTYSIDDASGVTSNTVTVSLTITPVNDAPVAVTDSFTVNEGSTTNLNLAANDTDADDGLDLTSIAIVSGPTNGSITVNADGTVDYTHDGSETISDSFTYTIDDASGATSNTVTVSLTVTPVNDAPVATADSFTVNEGSTTNLNLAANDTDADDGLDLTSISIVSGPSNGSIVVNADGTVDYTHDGSETISDSFTYTIDDASGATSNTVTVSLTVTPVNDAPVAADTTINATEDVVYNGTLPAANDAEGDAITYALEAAASNGTAVVNADGSFSYTPNANYNGGDSFTYMVSDASGSNTYTVTVNVAPVNNAPVATDDGLSTNEDIPLTITTATDLLGNDSDIDGDALSITGFTQPDNGTIVDNADGTWTYTPTNNFNGNDTFTYTISDGNGGIETATVTVTVNPVNDAPVATDTTINTTEDVVYNGTLPAASDTDGDPVTYALGTGASNGTAVVNADGTFSYTPNANYNGADSFTYTVDDGNGGSNTYTVTVNVAPVNDAPVANNDAFTVNEGSTTTLNLAANDTDADDGLDLTSITIVSGPTNGTITVNADGTVDYTHDGSETLADSFIYTIDDLNGTTSNTGFISVTITPVNDMPVASDDNLTTIQGTALTITTATNLLGNDTDAEGDPLSITGFTQPANGAVVNNADGTWTYTPNPTFIGVDSFTYTVDDGNGGTTAATLNVTVNAVVTATNNISTETQSSKDTQNSVVINSTSNDEQSAQQTIKRYQRQEAYETTTARDVSALLSVLNPLQVLSQIDMIEEAGDIYGTDRSKNGSQIGWGNALFNNELLWQELDQLRNDINDSTNEDGTIEGRFSDIIISIGSVSVTSGLIAWLLRGGSLAASFITAMPLWKGMDPLPVLNKNKKDHEDDDDDETKISADKRVERLIKGDSSHW